MSGALCAEISWVRPLHRGVQARMGFDSCNCSYHHGAAPAFVRRQQCSPELILCIS